VRDNPINVFFLVKNIFYASSLDRFDPGEVQQMFYRLLPIVYASGFLSPHQENIKLIRFWSIINKGKPTTGHNKLMAFFYLTHKRSILYTPTKKY
jgi:hypothetical protein